MANLKISQLTTYTGATKDGRWFVMNDIGETETFKFSGFTTAMRPGDTTNSIVSAYLDTNKVAGPNDFLAGPTNRIEATGGQSTIIGGEDNRITSASSGYNSIFGSFQSTINGNFGAGAYSARVVTLNGFFSTIIGSSESSNTNGRTSIIAGGEAITLSGQWNATLAGRFLNNSGESSVLLGGESNTLSSSYSAIVGGKSNTAASSTYQVMLGTSGRTATTDMATFVENLVIFDYSNLDFADDTAAAAGGVVLGQVYHNAGALRIRIT
jgi:hypothetical protein